MIFRTNVTLLVGLLLTAGCGAAPSPDASAAPVATGTAGAAALPPCAHEECPPCDETKQKCMGPMVCDGHPEKAKRVCARAADGKCASQLICD